MSTLNLQFTLAVYAVLKAGGSELSVTYCFLVIKMQHKPGDDNSEKVNAGSVYSVNPMDGLKSRMKEIREYLNETQKGMDVLLSLGKGSWQRYEAESGGNEPGSAVVSRLVQQGFNANWLLCGQGSMRNDVATVKETASEYNGDFVYIPRMVPVEVSTGHGSEPQQDIALQNHAFRREWIAARGLQARNLAIVTAKGDSMEPTISNDDIMLVDTSQNAFSQDGVYVVRLDGHLFAKRLQMGGSRILIVSDNKLYKDVPVNTDADDLKIIGKAVWIGRDL